MTCPHKMTIALLYLIVVNKLCDFKKGVVILNLFFMLKAAILGIIEGLTEFLPVSSTGHLIIFSHLIDFSSNQAFSNMFTMVIQLGAILAVLFYYKKKIIDTILHLFPSDSVPLTQSGLYFWSMIVISCVPAAAIGLPFDDIIESKLFNPLVVACALFIGGLWMIYAESNLSCQTNTSLAQTAITSRQALIIGIFQVLSIIPGVSRSASTIIGGWVAGLSTIAAAEYSFFLAVPVMIGQALIHILKAQSVLTPSEWFALGVGFSISFVVALIVIDSFLNFLQKKSMKIFAIYRIIFAFIVLACGALHLF